MHRFSCLLPQMDEKWFHDPRVCQNVLFTARPDPTRSAQPCGGLMEIPPSRSGLGVPASPPLFLELRAETQLEAQSAELCFGVNDHSCFLIMINNRTVTPPSSLLSFPSAPTLLISKKKSLVAVVYRSRLRQAASGDASR